MSSALRRDLLLAAARGAMFAIVLPAIASLIANGAPLASAAYAGSLAAPASLVEAWLRRRERVVPWLPVVWVLAVLSITLAHLQAVYGAAAVGGGLDAGRAALLDELGRMFPAQPPRRHLWAPPVYVASVVASGLAIALTTCVSAGSLAAAARGSLRVVAVWAGTALGLLVGASCSVFVFAALVEARLLEPAAVLWIAALLTVFAGPALAGLLPVWLLTARLVPPELERGRGQDEHGLPPVPPGA